MKIIFIILTLIFGLFTWINLDTRNNQDEYEEACLYFSTSIKGSRSCLEVYPEDHKSKYTWYSLGTGLVTLFSFIMIFAVSDGSSFKTNQEGNVDEDE